MLFVAMFRAINKCSLHNALFLKKPSADASHRSSKRVNNLEQYGAAAGEVNAVLPLGPVGSRSRIHEARSYRHESPDHVPGVIFFFVVPAFSSISAVRCGCVLFDLPRSSSTS